MLKQKDQELPEEMTLDKKVDLIIWRAIIKEGRRVLFVKLD